MPKRPQRRRILRVAIFALAGSLLWGAFHDSYHRFLAAASSGIARRTTPGFVLRLDGQTLKIRQRISPKLVPMAGLPILSFQFVIFLTLYGLRQPKSTSRAVARLSLAVGILVLTHLVALQIGIQSTVSLSFGDWSLRNYSNSARGLWLALWQGYMVLMGYAIVFALAWLLFPGPDQRATKQRR